jgi:hypothetical protein
VEQLVTVKQAAKVGRLTRLRVSDLERFVGSG